MFFVFLYKLTGIQAILNDLDVSSSHLERLSKDLAGNSNISQHFLESEQVKVKEAMLSLSALTPRFRSLTRVSCSIQWKV